jgi:hypothetical protein
MIVALWLLLQTSVVQNYIVQKVTAKLSSNLRAKVSIKHVDFRLFNKMLLQGALVLDRKNDTLLYAGTAKVNITDWFFFKDNIVLKYIGLDDGIIDLNRKDSVWNYQFMVDYFSSPGKKKDTSTNVVKLNLNTIELNRFKILQQDEWIGQNMLVSLNRLNLYTDDFDMNNNIIKINTLKLDHPVFSQYDYTGLRPVSNSSSTKSSDTGAEKPALRWNTDDWLFTIKNLQINNGSLAIERFTERSPLVNLFDDKHISFSSINATIKNFQFIKDTLTAKGDLAAKER